MADNFSLCMQFTGPSEGGYANLPGDSGGETNHGISDARDGVRDGLIRLVDGSHVPVRSLTKQQADAIYRAEYFDRIKGDQLPACVAVATFDYAVNSGIAGASKALQRACGAVPDGAIGPATLAALRDCDAHTVAAAVCDARINFLSTSTAPTIVRYRAALVARAQRCKAYVHGL